MDRRNQPATRHSRITTRQLAGGKTHYHPGADLLVSLLPQLLIT
jgi:hypothetical protein